MPGSSQFGAAPEPASGKERRLESWGEIASYLRREIRTVQRWEKTLGLPIHRLRVGKQSSVYAYPSELDKWYLEREPKESILRRFDVSVIGRYFPEFDETIASR